MAMEKQMRSMSKAKPKADAKKVLSNPTVRAAAKRKQAMAEKNIIAKKATAADKKMVEKAQSKSGFKRLNSISTAKRGK